MNDGSAHAGGEDETSPITDQIREEHWLPYVYGTAMLLLVSAAVFFGVHGLYDLRELQKPADNAAWTIAQLGFEHQRLIYAVDTAAEDSEVRLRGDIYLSYVGSLRTAPMFAALRSAADQRRLADLYGSAQTTGLLLDALGPEAGRRALAARLHADAAKVRELTIELAGRDYRLAQIERQHRNWVFTSNFMVLEGLMLGLISLSLFAYTIRKKLLETKEIRLASAELSRRNLELELQRSQAENASRAKTQFLSNMSHEIRTPLTGIIGTLQIIDPATLSPANRDLIGLVQRSSASLLEIVNSILSISKIEAEEVEVSVRPFAVRRLIADVLAHYEIAAAERGIDLFVEAAPALPASLCSDAVKIEQILHNLLSNALKFTERGSVTLAASFAPGAAEGPGGPSSATLQFRVADTGIGIEGKDQAKVFRPFYQVDGSLKRRHTGTGLGLNIAHKLAGILGGTIALESRPGQGTTFTVRLPVEIAAQHAGEAALRPAPPVALFGGRYSTIFRAAEALAQHGWRTAMLPESWPEASSPLPYAAALIDHRLGGGASRLAARLHGHSAGGRGIPAILVESAIAMTDAPADGRNGFAAAIAGSFAAGSLAELVAKLAAAPLPQEAGQDAARAREPAGDFADLRILVVDDNTINRRVLERLLKNVGALDIDGADSGAAAVRMAREATYDLVLMDIQMPEMDGYTATRLIRDGGHPQPRIIACSAHAFETDRRRSLDEGMDGHLPKPVQISELVSLLSSLRPPAEG